MDNVIDFINFQLSSGPRIPGSSGSIVVQKFFQQEMESSDWLVEKQNFIFDNTSITNIIAKSSEKPPEIIIATHYDTRAMSDNEISPVLRKIPVPGAIDGASASAILLELGKILDKSKLDVWIVFFDAEDQGGINGWEWSVGAQYFVDSLEFTPERVLIVDMVGDNNLEIYREKTSSSVLTESLWSEAEELGYSDFFIQTEKYSIFDDHTPFLNKGIEACLIIDIDYPHWHLSSDTIDKVSPASLEIVGKVIFSWLRNEYY